MGTVSVAANSDWEGSNPGTFRGAMWLDADPPPLKAALPKARPSKCFGVFLWCVGPLGELVKPSALQAEDYGFESHTVCQSGSSSMVRAPAFHAGGCEFESRGPLHIDRRPADRTLAPATLHGVQQASNPGGLANRAGFSLVMGTEANTEASAVNPWYPMNIALREPRHRRCWGKVGLSALEWVSPAGMVGLCL